MQTPSSHAPPDTGRHEQAAAPKPKLLDQVRQAIRARHCSKRTERTYADWIKRFILFHGKRHPLGMGEPEINQFLTDLAVNKGVSATREAAGFGARWTICDPLPNYADQAECNAFCITLREFTLAQRS